MTIRVDRGLRTRLRTAAARRSLSSSAAMRLALDSWLRCEETATRAEPFEQLADLLGCFAGPRELSLGVENDPLRARSRARSKA